MQIIFKEPKSINKTKVFLSRLKRKVFRHTKAIRIALLFSALAVVLLGFYLLALYLFQNTPLGTYKHYAQIFLSPQIAAPIQVKDKTNILILGKGGEGHTAPDLTDTIIFSSISPQNNKAVFISLPRDIWVPELRTKLNSVYYWGNQNKEGGGLTLSKSTIENILGQPIQYAAVMDFSIFKDIVDLLGGVNVQVENAFTDNLFPIPGRQDDLCDGDPNYKCRYETISFESGPQHMDGATALTFIRSRNAEGDEGTDIARSARQQKILEAIQKKISDPSFAIKNFTVYTKIFNLIQHSVETDLPPDTQIALARYLFDIKKQGQTDFLVLPEDLLENPQPEPRYDNLYVFIPRQGDWTLVHFWLKDLLNK